MKLIESKAEYIPQEEGLEGVYKQIELAGRTCYKSENNITEDSARDFVYRMIKSNHTAMLEHGTVYLSLSSFQNQDYPDIRDFYINNPYSIVNDRGDYYIQGAVDIFITTNFRVLVENNRFKDLKYVCNPREFHEKRYTLKFITDRGVSHELVRHRVFSFAQESTRYCNYSKDKFGNELTFIIPSWTTNLREGSFDDTLMQDAFWHDINGGEMMRVDSKEMCLMGVLNKAESCYMDSLERGLTPQQARQMLPNALKTEICMTGFVSDWRYFFDLRYYGKTGKPHPDMEDLASKAREELIKNNVWEDIMKYPSKFE